MHILVTGFDPFEDNQINPSWEAVKLLEDNIEPHTIDKLEIPTEFYQVKTILEQALKTKHYDAVLAIGQAGGRFHITPERVGINIDDARVADNQGQQPVDEPIVAGGAAAYFSNMPVKRMTQAIKDAGVPSKLSNTAGTFVCNHVLYQLGHMRYTQHSDLLFGFIHVPYLPEQVIDKPNTPAMSLDTMVKGLTAAIAAISTEPDATIALGETE